ncbi:hypothetical protein BDU57DRAFT_451666, partial [Ampelomyces quisqualis]
LLQGNMLGENTGYGKSGCYLGSPCSVCSRNMYCRLSGPMKNRGGTSQKADATVLDNIGKALGCPSILFPVQIGGKCTLKSERVSQIDWRAEYPSKHVLDGAETEAVLILKHLNDENDIVIT